MKTRTIADDQKLIADLAKDYLDWGYAKPHTVSDHDLKVVIEDFVRFAKNRVCVSFNKSGRHHA